MPKRNLYVDDELDAEIRAFDIPLSSVCQRALRGEVEVRRRLSQSPEEIKVAAQRLIGQRAAEAAKEFEDGIELGRRGHATQRRGTNSPSLSRIDRVADVTW